MMYTNKNVLEHVPNTGLDKRGSIMPSRQTIGVANHSKKRLKVLISAYSCAPYQGSEPGVGWNLVKHLSVHHDFWVILNEQSRARVEAYIADHLLNNVHFEFFGLPDIFQFFLRGNSSYTLTVRYYFWQLAVGRLMKDLHNMHQFDVVHHVTYVKYWNPSLLFKLNDVPFIWGPVGGGESTPQGFLSTLSCKGQLYERLRNWVRSIGEQDPLVKATARNSDVIFATTPQTAASIQRISGRNDVRVMSEAALSYEDQQLLMALKPNSAHIFRVISIGRLLDWKGFHLGLKAFKRFADHVGKENIEYWIVGDGPQRRYLEDLAQSLDITDRIHFTGKISREQVLLKLQDCNVFLHPSLHDSGGWVALEAMAAGLPVICLNYGGPQVAVADEAGIKINPCTPEQTTIELANAMQSLYDNFELQFKMGEAGRRHVIENFSWENRATFYADLYCQIVDSKRAVGSKQQ
jgi:glycosyltransferase involved in cell wall biosynthesis